MKVLYGCSELDDAKETRGLLGHIAHRSNNDFILAYKGLCAIQLLELGRMTKHKYRKVSKFLPFFLHTLNLLHNDCTFIEYHFYRKKKILCEI